MILSLYIWFATNSNTHAQLPFFVSSQLRLMTMTAIMVIQQKHLHVLYVVQISLMSFVPDQLQDAVYGYHLIIHAWCQGGIVITHQIVSSFWATFLFSLSFKGDLFFFFHKNLKRSTMALAIQAILLLEHNAARLKRVAV